MNPIEIRVISDFIGPCARSRGRSGLCSLSVSFELCRRIVDTFQTRALASLHP
jgi:hypothetical protein